MNRALRKRAKRLRSKSVKSLSKMKGQDLQIVSNRMSAEQYSQTLEAFENPPTDDAAGLAVHLARQLMVETEELEREQVPRFVPDDKMNDVDCCAGCAWCCHEPLQVSIRFGGSADSTERDRCRSLSHPEEIQRVHCASGQQ